MSNLNGSRSTFPTSVDTLLELFTLPASEKNNAIRYQYLILKGTLTAEEQSELNTLTGQLQHYIIDVEKWNLFGDILVNMQNFFVNETQGYIDNLQAETLNYVDGKKTEMNAYSDTKKLEIENIMAKFTFKGAYSSSVTYNQWNIVTYNGESYLSLIENNKNYTPNLAGSGAYWGKIATRGVQGVAGVDLSFVGAYDNATSYSAGQAVNHNEAIYQCLSTTVGNAPPNESYWKYFMSSNAVLVASTEPSSPTLNQLWIDTSNQINLLKFWDGVSWNILNAYDADMLGGKLPSEYALNTVATSISNGLMSSADKTKLDGIATNANNYVHPTTDGSKHVPATGTVNSGRVLKAGTTAGSFNWADETITTINGKTGAITKADIVALGIPASDTNTTYDLVTTVANGLMSATDKTKLNGIASGAQVNTVTSVAGKTGAVTLTKADVGLSNVENIKITKSTSDPSGGSNGDIWIKYTP